MIKVAKTRSFRGKNWEARREKAPRASRLHNPGNALPPPAGTGDLRMENNGENGDALCGVLRIYRVLILSSSRSIAQYLIDRLWIPEYYILHPDSD
jgi:hypothetical protein